MALEDRISFLTLPDQEESKPLTPRSNRNISDFVQQSQEQKHEFYSKDYIKEMRVSHLKEREDDRARIDSLEQYIENIHAEFDKHK